MSLLLMDMQECDPTRLPAVCAASTYRHAITDLRAKSSSPNDGRLCPRCETSTTIKWMQETNSDVPWQDLETHNVMEALHRPSSDDCEFCGILEELEHCALRNNDSFDSNKTALRDGTLTSYVISDYDTQQQRHWRYFKVHSSYHGRSRLSKMFLFPLHEMLSCKERNGVGLGVRIDENTADLTRVKHWLRLCEIKHDSRLSSCTPRQVPHSVAEILRIIDCRVRTIRPLNSGESYICLSYVWGRGSTRSLHHGLQLVDELPKTIEDAIYVANVLGIPQLWVDQCCIDQNDDRVRAATIRSMDKIYGGASLTIIASSTEDASGGLPGVRGTFRNQQHCIKIGSHHFVASGQVRDQVQRSRWASRGWTYQEGLVSTRRLVFTEEQVYFQCGNELCLEKLSNAVSFSTTGPWLSFSVFPRVGTVSSIESKSDAHALNSMLEEYLPRQLSYSMDSLAAFEGVINAQFNNRSLRQEFPKHFYGIPLLYKNDPCTENSFTSNFIAGLSWCMSKPGSNRTRLPTSEGRANPIPSWSWARPKSLYHVKRGDLTLRFCIPSNWRLPDSIAVTVTHKILGENKLDNIAASSSPTDYSDFLPHIDITTYIIVPKVAAGKSFAELWNVGSSADHWSTSFLADDTVSEVEGEQLALWLGLYMPRRDGFSDASKPYAGIVTAIFLICQENVDKETYSRVGLWFGPGFFYTEMRPLGFVEVMEKILQFLKPDFGIQHWGLTKVRLT